MKPIPKTLAELFDHSNKMRSESGVRQVLEDRSMSDNHSISLSRDTIQYLEKFRKSAMESHNEILKRVFKDKGLLKTIKKDIEAFEDKGASLRRQADEMAAQAHKEIAEAEEERREVDARIKMRQRHIEYIQQLSDWMMTTHPRLEKNDCSRLHKLVEYANNSKDTDGDLSTLPWGQTKPFVVQHDWAAAFAGAQDIEGEQFKLPFELCAFEFRISGKSVIAWTFEGENLVQGGFQLEGTQYRVLPFIEIKGTDGWEAWVVPPKDVADRSKVIPLIHQQIKAISIALEAEAATHDVVRAPEKLNRKRLEQGKLPLYSYHVVKLNRKRIANPLRPSGVASGRKVRLHFRRGHWRHYETHKTWIKWMLVGDPDLGFVDKEYRL